MHLNISSRELYCDSMFEKEFEENNKKNKTKQTHTIYIHISESMLCKTPECNVVCAYY